MHILKRVGIDLIIRRVLNKSKDINVIELFCIFLCAFFIQKCNYYVNELSG